MNEKAIQGNGISRIRKQANRPHGIFAMPVTRNSYVSHQWLRVLKRLSGSTIIGVYFRIPDVGVCREKKESEQPNNLLQRWP
jgi:hypothetical protein